MIYIRCYIKIPAGNILKYFFFYFSQENRLWHLIQMVSSCLQWRQFAWNVEGYFLGKKMKEKISCFSSAEYAWRVVNRGYSNVWSEYDFYFIEWSEKMYISWVLKARMKYTFFHFTRWNKSHIHDKHLNFLFIIYITFDWRDANLAFARGSLTRSFVPWWWHIRTA